MKEDAINRWLCLCWGIFLLLHHSVFFPSLLSWYSLFASSHLFFLSTQRICMLNQNLKKMLKISLGISGYYDGCWQHTYSDIRNLHTEVALGAFARKNNRGAIDTEIKTVEVHYTLFSPWDKILPGDIYDWTEMQILRVKCEPPRVKAPTEWIKLKQVGAAL